MLHHSIELVANAGQIQAFSMLELFSLEQFWQDIKENMQRALQNIYELDGIGQRKIIFSVALYVLFACVVSKVLSPRKKNSFFK